MPRRLSLPHRLLWLWLCLAPGQAAAHATSHSSLELTLDAQGARGLLRVARADLDAAVGVDQDADGRARDAELAEARAAIVSYLLARLELSNERGACPLAAGELRPEAAHVALELSSECPGARAVAYELFFEHDRAHQAFLRVSGAATLEHVFTSSRRQATLGAAGRAEVFAQYLGQGVHHIVLGADHVLFLLTLLLAAVVRWQAGQPAPLPSARASLGGVARIVTAFTAAHSVTLSLAALGVVAPASRWVEVAIALSIVAAAANNLWPLVTRQSWLLALGFGALHGFGFAGALSELGLPTGQRLFALLGFNLGVELGQLGVVALVYPALFWLARSAAYPRVALGWGSAAIGLLGLGWAIERAVTPPLVAEPEARSDELARPCPGVPALDARLERALERAGAEAHAARELACAGELERAARHLERGEAARAPAAERAARRRLQAEVEAVRGERSRAEALLAQAASLWREAGASAELADTLARAGELAARSERWADVYRSYDEARALHEQVGDTAALALDHSRLGDVLVSAADPRAARKHYERAREAHERLGDRAAVAREHRNLAIVARLEGDAAAATQMYRRAIEIHRERADLSELGADLAALARLHAGLGEHAEAQALYEQVIAIERELGRSRQQARAHNQLGNSHRLGGQLELAEQRYRRAAELGADDPVEAGNAWANLASLEQQRGRPGAARALYERSLALFERAGASAKVHRVRALLASSEPPAR